jgi:lipopolysaccharide heptosyltransferase I
MNATIALPERARILIVRLSSVGDVVHGLPVLCALRDSLPHAFIAWAVEESGARLLEGHEALDRMVVLPRRCIEDAWMHPFRDPPVLRRFFAELHALRFDLAIDVQGLTKSALVAWLARTPKRIGFTPPDGRQQSPWFNNVLVSAAHAHIVDRNLELLRPLGIEPPKVAFRLPRYPGEEQRMDRFLRGVGLTAGGFVLVSPGCGQEVKRWPTERFAAVIAQLGRSHGLPAVVLWAGAAERVLAEAVTGAAPEGAAFLAPPTDLREMASLARRCRLFLSADTGPLHIAAAIGAPCVGLFGPTLASRNGPHGDRHAIVQGEPAPGSRHPRRWDPTAMEAVTVEKALLACEDVLARTAQPP